MTDGMHLNDHHRDTVAQIMQHPTSHNIEWRAVVSLVETVGDIEEKKDGASRVTLGGESHVFERPKGKDIDVQQVVDLRRMLTAAGYGGDAERDEQKED